VYLSHGAVIHSRHGSKRNSFRYPVFALLFSCSDENQVAIQIKNKFKGLLSVQSEDYLNNRKQESLQTSIRQFLKENCEYEPEDVWLQTFPRMLGYVFNPVSFWFCKKQGRLDAVLCEVNNTFGERHFYWLTTATGIPQGTWLQSQKVFHVSPFFPIEGHYKFRFHLDDKKSRVDIFYYNDADELQLSTWIEGRLNTLDQEKGLSLLWRYGWMTPLIVLRIHWQAFRLWKLKVRFFSKPSPPVKEVT
jgi:DUF1365 family protein